MSHIDRVKKELTDLDEKINKLASFIASPNFDCIANESKVLLHNQLDLMEGYSDVLRKRIALGG